MAYVLDFSETNEAIPQPYFPELVGETIQMIGDFWWFLAGRNGGSPGHPTLW